MDRGHWTCRLAVDPSYLFLAPDLSLISFAFSFSFSTRKKGSDFCRQCDILFYLSICVICFLSFSFCKSNPNPIQRNPVPMPILEHLLLLFAVLLLTNKMILQKSTTFIKLLHSNNRASHNSASFSLFSLLVCTTATAHHFRMSPSVKKFLQTLNANCIISQMTCLFLFASVFGICICSAAPFWKIYGKHKALKSNMYHKWKKRLNNFEKCAQLMKRAQKATGPCLHKCLQWLIEVKVVICVESEGERKDKGFETGKYIKNLRVPRKEKEGGGGEK